MSVLLKGGHVIDPSNGLNKEPCDVLIDGKQIVKVEEDIQLPEGGQLFDASGYLVCPGLIDMHVHCFPGGTLLGVDPDEWCLKRGVTTVVDAGSAGKGAIARWYKQIILRACTHGSLGSGWLYSIHGMQVLQALMLS